MVPAQFRENLAQCLCLDNSAEEPGGESQSSTGCGQRLALAHTLSCTRGGLMNYTHGAMLCPGVRQVLRDSSIQCQIENIAAIENTLRIGITTKPEAFVGHEKNTRGLTIIVIRNNPMAVLYISSSARQSHHVSCMAKENKGESYRGSFDPAIHTRTITVLFT